MPRAKEIQKQMRKKVIEIYQSGKGYKAISKALGLPRTTVRAIIYKWPKHGTVENLPRSDRPTKITPRAQRQLIQEVTKDPTTTSKELQASLASVKWRKLKNQYDTHTDMGKTNSNLSSGSTCIGGSVVGFLPIMQKARVRFPPTGCSAGPKPGKMGGLCQEGHLA
ncbi:hypothetical protein QTP86_002964 [Hemibagrus guttatus]|nr:hypothetical protein QTP86_002964 [Hemibagrus guttatus]